MTEAAAKLSSWLSSREAVDCVARHLGCALEAADRRIDDVGRGGRIQARGVVAGQPVLVLPADWNGRVDLAGTTMKPPEGAEITNLELCYIDLIAAGLLPAPAAKAWWSAAEAIAYLVKGVPLPWEAWQRAGASPAEIEQAEIDLGAEILARGCRRRAGQAPSRRSGRYPPTTFIPTGLRRRRFRYQERARRKWSLTAGIPGQPRRAKICELPRAAPLGGDRSRCRGAKAGAPKTVDDAG